MHLKMSKDNLIETVRLIRFYFSHFGEIVNPILKTLTVALFSLLSACASTYQPPTIGDTAKIRYLNASKNGRNVVVFAYEKNDCVSPQVIGHLDERFLKKPQDTNVQFIPLNTESDQQKSIEVAIPAEKPFISYIRLLTLGSYSTSCRVTFSFTPKKDGMYEAIYDEDDSHCFLTLNTIKQDKNGKFVRYSSMDLLDPKTRQCRF
jgi:hypothetical protein